jgi:histidyl-tRNA synthetase
LPQQFKQAETGGIPFAIILGEDELAQGKLKIKELGLPDGHAEKDGVLVEKSNIVAEVRKRLETFYQQEVVATGVEQISV